MSINLDKDDIQEERLRELKKTRKDVLQLKHQIKDIHDQLSAISYLFNNKYGLEIQSLVNSMDNLEHTTVNLYHKIHANKKFYNGIQSSLKRQNNVNEGL